MTILGSVSFKGLSSTGHSALRDLLLESRSKVAELLGSAASCQGESVNHIFTCSATAFKSQWEHYEDVRAISVAAARDEVLYFIANIILYLSVLLFAAWIAPRHLDGAALLAARFGFAVGMAVLATWGTLRWVRLLAQFLRSRAIGHVDLFIDRNLLAYQGWAVSDAAVYVVSNEEQIGERGPTVLRIPFNEIQRVSLHRDPLGNCGVLSEVNGRRHDLYEPEGDDGFGFEQLCLLISQQGPVELSSVLPAAR